LCVHGRFGHGRKRTVRDGKDTFDYNRFNKWRMCLELSKGLTEFEKKVYNFVKERGEVLICNIPSRMMGAVPDLKNRGLVEVYKKLTTPWASKKRKFVRVIERTEIKEKE